MKEETFDEIIQSAAFAELMQSAKEAALILRGNLPPASEFVCTGTNDKLATIKTLVTEEELIQPMLDIWEGYI